MGALHAQAHLVLDYLGFVGSLMNHAPCLLLITVST